MKIFKLLNSLSKNEIKLLRKAVHSPLLNTNKSVIQLFELLRKQHPDFEDSIAVKRKLFKKLFPKEAYYDHKLRRLFFELTKIIENVLLQLHYEVNPFERRKKLVTIYKQRGIDALFQKETNDVLVELEKSDFKSANYYQHKLELLTTKYFHPLYDKYKLADDILKKIDDCLDTHYMISKLRLTIALKSRVQVMNEQYNYRFIDSLKIENKKGFQADNILVELYLDAVNLMDNYEDAVFNYFEKKLFGQITQFDLIDQLFIFHAGLNIAYLKKRENVTSKYQNTPLKWLKFGIKHHLLTEANIMQESIFANVVIQGCQAKEYEWVKRFIETHKSQLRVKDLASSLLYYEAIIFFLQKDWDKTLELLNISAKKAIYPPRIRTMLIRTLFEKFLLDDSYFDSLMANLQAFEVYIRRDKYFADGRLLAHLKFVQILRLLTKKIFAKQEKGEIEQWFNKAMADNPPIQSKKWLIEKVTNL